MNVKRNADSEVLACEVSEGNKDFSRVVCWYFRLQICGCWLAGDEGSAVMIRNGHH